MLRHSANAVVARNEAWQGSVATEPYEAGWALEAVVFVRALALQGDLSGTEFRVQVSPDGMHWVDEGSRFPAPARQDETTFCRVAQFGAWLRIVAELPAGAVLRPLVTLSLKG